jgi:TIR domain
MSCDIFLSYTHIKDALRGAVSEFRNHLENEVIRKTGRQLTVFRINVVYTAETSGLKCSEPSLKSAKLLLILLSPTWLNSEWCKQEYTIFCESRPLRPIFPLLWDKIQNHHVPEGSEAHAIYSKLKEYQIIDWSTLSYTDWVSPEPNIVLGGLAERIDTLLAPVFAATEPSGTVA